MQLIPIKTDLLKEGDDLAAILKAHNMQEDDILVVSSKAISTVEGNVIDLQSVTVSDEARSLAEECGNTPEYRQAMLNELQRMNGRIAGKSPHAILTEVRPDGLTEGSILIASAGLDTSNTKEGTAIGWPHDPVASAQKLRAAFDEHIAVIITDSCCRPRRLGVSALALCTAGIDPLADERGREDLFGRALRMTHESRADQLATAANMLMGNADQAIPAVIVRDHGFPLSDFSGWVPGIDAEEDIFRSMFQ